MNDAPSFTVENATFRPLTSAELLTMEIPPRSTLLRPWLDQSGIAMMYAPRGVGKTYLALAAAYAVASGGTLLHWKAPKARPVLYLDGEMPLTALQERLAGIAMSADAHPPEDDFLRFLPADNFRDGLPDLASQQGRELVQELAKGVSLVVLDNLSSLARGRENDADDWQSMQDLMLCLRRSGTTTLIVHHSGKGGQQRGTSRREDVMDTVISLRRPDGYNPKQGARFEVHFEKSRGFTGADATPFEASLLISPEGAITWQISELNRSSASAAFALFSAGKTASDVAKEFGVDRSTAYRWQKTWKNGRVE